MEKKKPILYILVILMIINLIPTEVRALDYYNFDTSSVPSDWNVYSDTGVLQVGELASGVSGDGRHYLRWTVSGYWDRLKVSSVNVIAGDVDFWINIHNYGIVDSYPERGLSVGVWSSGYNYAVNTIAWGKDGLYRYASGSKAKIATYSINTWYHVRFSWDCTAGYSKVYIDQTLISTWSISTYSSYSQFTFLNSMNLQPRYVDIDEFYANETLGDPTLPPDADEDGMTDVWETENGLDPEDETDAFIDSDSDGLLNIYEFGNTTDPQDADSDNDLLNDGPEVMIYNTNPNDPDSDNDGLNDGIEINTYSTDPHDADSDGDSLTDGMEVNTHNTDPNDPDSDNDLLTDNQEITLYFTDPNNPDSDGDTFSDKFEIDTGTDPNDENSYLGSIEPVDFTIFITLILLAIAVAIGGTIIAKKQRKMRFS